VRGFDAADQRAAVALSRDRNEARAELFGDGLGAVGATVVGDDDLGRQAVFLDRQLSFVDAGGQRLSLVQAGHHDRDLDRTLNRR
jgi:hypothetical protein